MTAGAQLQAKVTTGVDALGGAAADEAVDNSGFHLTEVLAPRTDGGFAELVLLGRIGHAGLVCFAQHGDHLLVGESDLSDGLLAGWQPSS